MPWCEQPGDPDLVEGNLVCITFWWGKCMMYKSGRLHPLTICCRLAGLALIWLVLLAGFYQVHRASELPDQVDAGLKRLALYSLLMGGDR